MSWTVAERGHCLATFRSVEVRLMEMVAAWTPTTPETDVKVLFGRHIWDFAQHADALGKRTFELRLPLQHSRAAAEPYRALLDATAALATTADRLGGLYDLVLPDLDTRYRTYLDASDRVLDAPSRDIVERIRVEEARQREEAMALRRDLGLSGGSLDAIRQRLATLDAQAFVAAETVAR